MKARRATVDRIVRAGRLLRGRLRPADEHALARRRCGDAVLDHTPFDHPVARRGSPHGSCAPWLARSVGCHRFCSWAGRSTKVKPTSCRPAVTATRGDVIGCRTPRAAPAVDRGLVVRLAADRRQRHLLAVMVMTTGAASRVPRHPPALRPPSSAAVRRTRVLAVGRKGVSGARPPRVPSGRPSTCWFCVTTMPSCRSPHPPRRPHRRRRARDPQTGGRIPLEQ